MVRDTHAKMPVLVWMCLGCAALVMAVSVVLLITGRPGEGADRWAVSSQRGDYWGGHLGSFSGVASTFLLLAALMVQREELRAQREELLATREEMALARGVYQQQEKQMDRQAQIAERFSTIGALLNIVQIRDELIASTASVPSEDRQFMRNYARDRLARLTPVARSLLGTSTLTAEDAATLRGALGPWYKNQATGEEVLTDAEWGQMRV